MGQEDIAVNQHVQKLDEKNNQVEILKLKRKKQNPTIIIEVNSIN